ncbi:beta-galactosidase GalA [Hymenobacter nivis]|uniref:Glycoside hydrolase family 2 protein n=1 Tax=Hymenobacter nivis TaxID=1850093 RepID=A0A502H1I3_9BACT|nr:beta-galactosidase GalA [Hymenobacter nivis]TPG67552.1 glycoside hydrolase family 2 protein [Hymenobacter nivis]
MINGLSSFCATFLLLLSASLASRAQGPAAGREHLLLDAGWRFAYGHPSDPKQDFTNGTSYFSYLAKTGNGDGAAAVKFDDRAWRQLDLPHDWAVEQGFSEQASFSHGFKTVGRAFPNTSVGWYRKSFAVPASDLGRRISLDFDGVYRNSIVWVNGHYLGTQASGYNGFQYDISDYLHYDGKPNVIAVRVDATMEEGWFYEGAGIYRHTWLTKTAPLHVAPHGTFVTTKLDGSAATLTAKTTIKNSALTPQTFDVVQDVVDAAGQIVATTQVRQLHLGAAREQEFTCTIPVANARLWSIETPYLYKLVTRVQQAGAAVDQYETRFGVRTIRFDANEGFFLNGQHVKIKGTNNHQEHAGVGTAIPDALQDWRIRQLKSFGSNAYRCSHNPPTPELLDACDRLGMLVIDENRLMGITEPLLNELKTLMVRDRNHPSIISWSIGNEEWAIESNVLGARIAATMQAYAKTIDSTRAITAGISGGWGQGTSTTIDVMGYNYIAQGSTDAQHAKFPQQPGWGTEEGSTFATRGVYVTDMAKHYIAAYDKKPRPSFYSIEEGWRHYADRPYLAGLFIWTGFDYRGEATPFRWPSVTSYFGMLDLCGFPKDDYYYLKSWWTTQPTLHLLPHWNWAGKEGQPIDVWAYSNCDEVELFLNNKSLGKKAMTKNSHLEWQVPYASGTLAAVGYRNGKKIATDQVQTTGPAAAIALAASSATVQANGEDVSVVTVRIEAKNQRLMPTADSEVTFSLRGPGKIIGVGNGDPTSLEPDQFLPTVRALPIENVKEKGFGGPVSGAETGAAFDDSGWGSAAARQYDAATELVPTAQAYVNRGSFELPADLSAAQITFFYQPIGQQQSIYINGHALAQNLTGEQASAQGYQLDKSWLKPGRNSLAVVSVPFVKKQIWDVFNIDPGTVQVITPAAAWRRKAFNGLAQVLVQGTRTPGDITLTATAPGLKASVLKIKSVAATPRPAL